MATFFAKFLRPDRKDKSKERHDPRKRHSAPVPDWFDVSDVMAMEKQQKRQPEQNVQKQKGTPAKENPANVKKRSNKNRKKNKNKANRHSSALSYFSCMSGNVDTLERTPMPSTALASQANTKTKDVKNGADFMREDKVKNKNARNRYSAPVPDWMANQMLNEFVDKGQNGGKPADQRNSRELSPAVKYRVDGTIERPYVFPGGLTFGPEGRKTPLRRTSPEYSSSHSRASSGRSHKRVVEAEVHNSRENIIMEYSDGDADPRDSDFDVRKAFYLKYDSNPDSHDREKHNKNYDDQYREKELRHSKRGRSKKRYSMPQKNEEFVYMGSFENINIDPVYTEEHDRVRRSKRDKKKNRYSLPPKNSDFIYMGSFENLTQTTGTKTPAPVLSQPKKLGPDPSYPEIVSDIPDSANREEMPTIHHPPGPADSGQGVHANYSPLVLEQPKDTPQYETPYQARSRASLPRDSCRRSLPELNLPGHLSVPKLNRSDGHSDVEYEDEETDFFDDNLSFGRSSNTARSCPFSRNVSRSSCMPGNKRITTGPPPCVFPMDLSSCVDSGQAAEASDQLSSPSEAIQFYIPPPPDYTPPREVMAETYQKLSSSACHKCSQTDLNMDWESLNMEDRDMSLKREEAKTLMAGISTSGTQSMAGPNELNGADAQVQNIRKQEDHFDRLKNLTQHRQLNISCISQGSDDVFTESQSSALERLSKEISPEAFVPQAPTGFVQFQYDTIDTPPVSFTNFLPNNDIPSSGVGRNNSEDIRGTNTSTGVLVDLHTGNIYDNNVKKEAVTSTPKITRRPNRASSANSEKPVPCPRKRFSIPGLNRSNSENVPTIRAAKENTPTHKPQPVPRKRRTLTHQLSAPVGSECQTSSCPDRTRLYTDTFPHSRDDVLYDTVPANDAEEDVRSLTSHTNQGDSVSEANVYEEIDDHSVENQNIPSNSDEYEHIYATCDEMQALWADSRDTGDIDRKQHVDHILPDLQEMKLVSSPRPARRVQNRPFSTVEGISSGQRAYYFGLSSSMADLTTMFTGPTSRSHNQNLFDVSDDHDSDDENSIADDEMSISNDEYHDETMKKRSLRKCVSADDLLRSGSILDRSMILARRRRLRLRERKCKSHMLSSTETDDGDPEWSYKSSTKGKVRFHDSKRKNSVRDSPTNKQKLSHTDSGHDSDIMSPCTSPDARKLLEHMTPLNDISEQRQGTLTKKPWELRLSQMQKMRKSRSREKLCASTSRLERFSKTKMETIV